MPNELTFPPGPIGTGVTIQLNNAEWSTLNYMRCRINTTQTAGNRQFLFLFNSGAGDVLFTAVQSLVPSGTAAVFSLGGGVSAFASESWFTLSLPTAFLLPPRSSLFIRDGNSVDAEDVIATLAIVMS